MVGSPEADNVDYVLRCSVNSLRAEALCFGAFSSSSLVSH